MWLDLKMRGIDPESIRPMMKSLLISHAARKRDQQYVETMLLVRAILTGAALMAGDNGAMDGLRELQKHYTDLVYPEDAHEMEDKMTKVKEIIEKEVARGPMQVIPQDYDKKRKKKPR